MIALSIDGRPRLLRRGDADDVAAAMSDHRDQCSRIGADPGTLAKQALAAAACGTNTALTDGALVTCAIYFVANCRFEPWTGLQKLAAGCDVALDLREALGKVEYEILAGAPQDTGRCLRQ